MLSINLHVVDTMPVTLVTENNVRASMVSTCLQTKTHTFTYKHLKSSETCRGAFSERDCWLSHYRLYHHIHSSFQTKLKEAIHIEWVLIYSSLYHGHVSTTHVANYEISLSCP